MKSAFVTVCFIFAIVAGEEVEKTIKLTQSGAVFEETITVDTTENIEVDHMSKHLDVDEAYFLKDYNRSLEVIKPVKKDACFLRPLLSLYADPMETKDALSTLKPTDIVTLPKRKESTALCGTVVKDRSILGSRALKLCENVPVYWLQQETEKEEGTLDRRHKRAAIMSARVCLVCNIRIRIRFGRRRRGVISQPSSQLLHRFTDVICP